MEYTKNNLFYDNKIKNAVVYNWKALYRQNNDWGFCIPKNIYDKIKNYKSYFDIEIKTKTKKSNMKVLDFHIKGRSKKLFYLMLIIVIHFKLMMIYLAVQLE